MKNKADNERLLDDVLTEAAPSDFREALLGETLRVARGRRRRRQTHRVAAMVIALGLCGIFVWENTPLSERALAPVSSTKAVEGNCTLIETQPLPAADIVTTETLSPGEFTVSMANVEFVQTRSGNYRAISDDELLALVASHPALLIRTSLHSEELVFANPEDGKGFPLN